MEAVVFFISAAIILAVAATSALIRSISVVITRSPLRRTARA